MKYKIYIPPHFKPLLKKVKKKHHSANKDLLNKLAWLTIKLEKKEERGLPDNTYKVRLSNTGEKRGKSYGFRLVYNVYKDYIIPIFFYSKTENRILSFKQKEQIRKWVKEITQNLSILEQSDNKEKICE